MLSCEQFVALMLKIYESQCLPLEKHTQYCLLQLFYKVQHDQILFLHFLLH